MSAISLMNSGFPSPLMAALPIRCLVLMGDFALEMVQVEMRFRNPAESSADGKYFRMAAIVEGSKIARAVGTLCLQFPGCRTLEESFGDNVWTEFWR